MHAHLIDEFAVRAWMDAYRLAWIGRDADAVDRLFAPDACYRERRYTPALRGVDAIRGAWRGTAVVPQRDITFDYTLVGLRGYTACIHWQASFARVSTGSIDRLDVLSRVSFSVDQGQHGLVAYAWDEWLDKREPETTKTAIGRSLQAS